MRALVVCVSASNGNTRKVAETVGDVLDAAVVEPEDVRPEDVPDYDLVGFGSGIYYGMPHRRLRNLVARLPRGGGAKAFVFATSGAPDLRGRWTRPVAKALQRHGYDVVGTFTCRGWDTWFPLRLIGGLNRGHPDEADLANARAFARRLADRLARPAPVA